MRTRTKVAGGVGGGGALYLFLQLWWEVYANAEDPRMIGDVARFLADPPPFLVLAVLTVSLWLLWTYSNHSVAHAKGLQAVAEDEVAKLRSEIDGLRPSPLAGVKGKLQKLSLRGKELRDRMLHDHPDVGKQPVNQSVLPTYAMPESPYEDVVPWLTDCTNFIERELGPNEARRLTDPFGDIWDRVQEAGWTPSSVYWRLGDVARHLDDLAITITSDDLARPSGLHK